MLDVIVLQRRAGPFFVFVFCFLISLRTVDVVRKENDDWMCSCVYGVLVLVAAFTGT